MTAKTDPVKTTASDLSFAELIKKGNAVPSKPRRHAAVSLAPAVYTRPIPIPSRIKPGPVEYRKSGLKIKEFEQLKRRRITPQNTIDLHGHTIRQACDALENFIVTAQAQDLRCVSIICGKGTRSKDGKAVLRDFTRLFLEQHSKVLAYCPALPQDGGDGAIYTLLKSREGKKHP